MSLSIRSRFILTMWYVKVTVIINIEFETKRFYINYVVCKDLKDVELQNSYGGFILTMWYVKQLTSEERAYYNQAFYINYVVCKAYED